MVAPHRKFDDFAQSMGFAIDSAVINPVTMAAATDHQLLAAVKHT